MGYEIVINLISPLKQIRRVIVNKKLDFFLFLIKIATWQLKRQIFVFTTQRISSIFDINSSLGRENLIHLR